MATTDIDICNLALLMMDNADNYVTNITSAPVTKEDRAFTLCYTHIRDLVLEAFPWGFASKLAKITVDASAPTFGFLYRYAYPNDCVALRKISDSEIFTDPCPNYEIRAGYIECDVPSYLYVNYTYKHTTPANYPERFVHALAARLAVETAGSLIGASTAKIAQLMAGYKAIIAECHRIDAVEDSSKQNGYAGLISIRGGCRWRRRKGKRKARRKGAASWRRSFSITSPGGN